MRARVRAAPGTDTSRFWRRAGPSPHSVTRGRFAARSGVFLLADVWKRESAPSGSHPMPRGTQHR
eukprot:2312899-Alexandrium_andersonii.AAC.1